MRPTWCEYFLDMAEFVSQRSTCDRRKVGAVLVRGRKVLTTGYNGPPSGLVHCENRGCMREEMGVPSGERHELCWGVHAEQNAIIQAALHGITTKGATLYSTTSPCIICAKMIINAGIDKVVCAGGYPDDMAGDILTRSSVLVAGY